jgi:glycerol-1-phosphate dehydrogenase [NAD(P)+]
MVAAPLFIDIRSGAVDDLARSLADGRIAPGGRLAVAIGPRFGNEIAETLDGSLEQADLITVTEGSVDAARAFADQVRHGSYEAIVGIGGGRTIDVAKYAAGLTGLPMVSVATTLAHDGIASPVASLERDGRKGSHGVPVPIAVFVDLDYVRRAPRPLMLGGVGDVLSNLSAIADWQRAAATRGEQFDGLAAGIARSAAESLIWRDDDDTSDTFLTSLAEALVLSGMAMAVAGTSRPCSGADHTILHSINELYPGTAGHGELAGMAADFCTYLAGDERLNALIDGCLRRHALPRLPSDVGLTDEQFAVAVEKAPMTRPDRWTILNELALSEAEMLARVRDYTQSRPG